MKKLSKVEVVQRLRDELEQGLYGYEEAFERLVEAYLATKKDEQE